MSFDPDKECPISYVQGEKGLERGPCTKHDCHWFIQLQGTNPQTGLSVDEWGCAVAWLPTLLIENAKEVRQGAAAIESFRNEMVRPNPALVALAEQLEQTPSEPVVIPGGHDGDRTEPVLNTQSSQ